MGGGVNSLFFFLSNVRNSKLKGTEKLISIKYNEELLFRVNYCSALPWHELLSIDLMVTQCECFRKDSNIYQVGG